MLICFISFSSSAAAAVALVRFPFFVKEFASRVVDKKLFTFLLRPFLDLYFYYFIHIHFHAAINDSY